MFSIKHVCIIFITKHCNDLILFKIECKHSTSIFERVQYVETNQIATLDYHFKTIKIYVFKQAAFKCFVFIAITCHGQTEDLMSNTKRHIKLKGEA